MSARFSNGLAEPELVHNQDLAALASLYREAWEEEGDASAGRRFTEDVLNLTLAHDAITSSCACVNWLLIYWLARLG